MDREQLLRIYLSLATALGILDAIEAPLKEAAEMIEQHLSSS
jgi:hypothetical protein